ncbi:MAG TPA: HAMP domain-containing sensor histidine kinase [Planctomycetota bacterium]|nr:HAMP domain-containing sensor histidine kinase [Planctomycetota bacterium]
MRKSLTFRILFVSIWLALAPLGFVGWFVLGRLEKLINEEVKVRHEQMINSADRLLQQHLTKATTKLRSIGQMVKPGEDPQKQTQTLNALLEPPDIFLEIGAWSVGKEAEVITQAQQLDYNSAQNAIRPGNRAYNPRVKQLVSTWSNDAPILKEAAAGNTFIGDSLETVGSFTGLPISVPAGNGLVLTAIVDFKPVSQLLQNVTPMTKTLLLHLQDASGKILANSNEGVHHWPPEAEVQPTGMPFPVLEHRNKSLYRNTWEFVVQESREEAFETYYAARKMTFLWLGIAVAFGLFFALGFSAEIRHSIRTLGRTAEQIRAGDLSARAGLKGDDEFARLGREFDRMAASVQKLDEMKGEFVAHVSHELRTPLTSAKITLANVQEGIGGKESLGRVQEDLDRLIRMVNELLDVARIEAGFQLAKQASNLGGLVRSAADSLRPLAKVPLTVTGSGDTIDLDPARVQQIVVNLVDNALKYAKSRVDVEVNGREVRVRDDGPGVPAEHRERIFEKFSKVETGPKPPGAGLGLSIARKLAQLHGGSLICDGNTFVLRF